VLNKIVYSTSIDKILLFGRLFLQIFILSAGGFPAPQVALCFVVFKNCLYLLGKLLVKRGQPLGHILVDSAFTHLKHLGSLPDCGLGFQDIDTDIQYPLLDVLLHITRPPVVSYRTPDTRRQKRKNIIQDMWKSWLIVGRDSLIEQRTFFKIKYMRGQGRNSPAEKINRLEAVVSPVNINVQPSQRGIKDNIAPTFAKGYPTAENIAGN